MRRLFNWLREEIPWLRRWKVEDQIAYGEAIEVDEDGTSRRNSSGLPPQQPSDDGA